MATPPKPPKAPKAGSTTPAPRRSTRTASTAKPAAARAPAAKPKSVDKAPAAEAPVAKPPVAPKPTAARKPAARKTAPKSVAKTTATPLAAKPAAVMKQAAAALPPVGRKTAWSIGAIVVAAGAGLAAFLTRGRIGSLLSSAPQEGHVPTDLLDPQRNADDRAVADFRPNMDAPMTPAEREALRPATGSAPSLVADRGTLNAQSGPTE